MTRFFKLLFISPLLFLFGCAVTPQSNITFQQDFLSKQDQKIGIYVSAAPEVKGHISGAACLLCYATASAINSDLDTHMKTQSNEDLNELKAALTERLTNEGATVVDITDLNIAKLPKNTGAQLNFAKNKFDGVGTKHDVNQVLVVDMKTLGTLRNFANYIPVGDPYAVFNAVMYMVDTTTNAYTFYELIDVKQYSDSPWKEEGFPGITNAYYTAIETGKSQILDLHATVTPEIDAEPEKDPEPEDQARNDDENNPANDHPNAG
ncbi:MAG: hypothetical protein K6L76_01280 [Agarilytica sp.]